MKDKIYNVINKIYGYVMFVSFFAGILPLIPFIVAICIGGETGEKISLFLYNEYFPWVIALASIAVVIGLIGIYVKKFNCFTKRDKTEKEDKKSN